MFLANNCTNIPHCFITFKFLVMAQKISFSWDSIGIWKIQEDAVMTEWPDFNDNVCNFDHLCGFLVSFETFVFI